MAAWERAILLLPMSDFGFHRMFPKIAVAFRSQPLMELASTSFEALASYLLTAMKKQVDTVHLQNPFSNFVHHWDLLVDSPYHTCLKRLIKPYKRYSTLCIASTFSR
jgi:hypothetical protein